MVSDALDFQQFVQDVEQGQYRCCECCCKQFAAQNYDWRDIRERLCAGCLVLRN